MICAIFVPALLIFAESCFLQERGTSIRRRSAVMCCMGPQALMPGTELMLSAHQQLELRAVNGMGAVVEMRRHVYAQLPTTPELHSGPGISATEGDIIRSGRYRRSQCSKSVYALRVCICICKWPPVSLSGGLASRNAQKGCCLPDPWRR